MYNTTEKLIELVPKLPLIRQMFYLGRIREELAKLDFEKHNEPPPDKI